MRNALIVAAAALFVVSCSPSGKMQRQEQAPDPGQKSVAREAIEGFTGKTAVNNLNRAKPKIEAANEVGRQSREDIDLLTGK